MSDPPPKKVGSLRDRIAAFENKGPAPTPGPAPVPRPKPAGASTWQPKPRTPPESPRASVDNGERKAGMSAADAKESITKGGSLKERMAALQGRGGFDLPGGASPPPIAPKPAVERPKWKPPPVVSPPPAEDDEEVGDAPKPPSISPPQEERDEAPKIAENAEAEGGTSAEEAGEEKEVDPEEEERQRRAAIAARIARLGGARVGMTAPPIFGKKPDVKRSGSVKSKEEDAPKPSPPVEATKEEAKPEPAPEVASPPIAKVEDSEPVGTPAKVEGGSQDYFGATTEPSASSTLLPDSAASSVKSPSMPVPTVPRRAAPPRKKAAKSPAPQPVLDDGITQSPASTPLLGDDVQAQDAIEAIQESKEVEQAGTRSPELKPPVEPEAPIPQPRPTDEDTLSEAKSVEPSTDDIHEVHAESVGEAASVPTELHANAEGSEEDEVVPASKHQEPTAIEVSKTEEPEVVQEEEDEAARRKRIADRLAKSGGFNPFSGLPPPMKSPSLPPATSDAEESASSPPAPPQRRSSTRQANTEPADELPSTPALPERRLSTRRESTDSNVRPPPPPVRRASTVSTDEPLRSPVIPTSPKLDAPARKGSTASVGSEGSLPAGKLSQDDHKSIHESVHHHQSGNNEDIAEEPEAETSHGTENEEAAVHEVPEDRAPERADRLLSSEGTYNRRVSYLQVEEEEAEDDVHDYQAYEPVISDRASSPRLAYEDEEHDSGAVESAEYSRAKLVSEPEAEPEQEEEPEPIPPPRPSIPPPTKRASIPPPPRAVPSTPDLEPSGGIHNKPPISRRSIPPPPVVPPEEDEEEDEEEDSTEQKAPPSLTSWKSPPPPATGPISPPPPVPPLPRHLDNPSATPQPDDEKDSEDVSARPFAPPERKDSVPALSRDTSSPPPPPRPPAHSRPSIPVRTSTRDEEPQAPSRPTALPSRQESLPRAPSVPRERPVQPHALITDEPEEREILGEEDGDPIDPTFHSPIRTGSSPSTPAASPSPPPSIPAALVVSEEGEDEEASRRRTIAERMAKLGGIRFGAPMPVQPRPAPAAVRVEESSDDTSAEREAPQDEASEEENEFARKQRIAARIAGMGGMRLGMIPGMIPPPPPVSSPPAMDVPPAHRENDGAAAARPPPLAPRVPPPPPPPHVSQEVEDESGFIEQSYSDDGEHIEAEESELEEVSHEDAEEEEAPPPIPSRPVRQNSTLVSGGAPSRSPPIPPAFARPPVPHSRPPPPPADLSQSTLLSPTRPPVGPSSPSDYVMVESESAEEPPPLPPSRPSRAPPPPRAAPPPPATPPEMPDSMTQSGWELPQIPSSTLDFGTDTDLSSSGQWSEVATPEGTSQPGFPPPPVPAHEPIALEPARRPSSAHVEANLSSDELMSQWGRVGVQIHEVAANMYEKSKKTVVGDGTYTGFISAVVGQIPNAAQPSGSPHDAFGYLIYSQVASALQRRASDIMPGDIIVLHDAKLKGHKGLQMYNQNVGVGEPLVAIVADFEAKRSKVKVFQANQHVGQQSVESVSYRLEDVKSGTVKIYRVLEK